MANDGPTAGERFIAGIIPENPTFRQLLGMCPTLAVSNTVKGAVTMAIATTVVLLASNIFTSLIRHALKPHLRILVFTASIAAFVTVIDRLLAAYMYDMSKLLGPYIPLIIVNCIIICRCEVCSAKQGLGPSIGDAFGQGMGFLLGLVLLATVREILGCGTWFGLPVLSPFGWPAWTVMVLPPGAFLTLGLLMAGVNRCVELRAARAKAALALATGT